MIAEDAGRDARYIANLKTTSTFPLTSSSTTACRGVLDVGRAGRRLRRLGRDQQQIPPVARAEPIPGAAPTRPTINNNAGNNDEIFSFHPGGANVLFGDGSVQFMKETTSLLVLRRPGHPVGRRGHLRGPVLNISEGITRPDRRPRQRSRASLHSNATGLGSSARLHGGLDRQIAHIRSMAGVECRDSSTSPKTPLPPITASFWWTDWQKHCV